MIRPNWFMQNFHTFWLHGIQTQGQIFLPVGNADHANTSAASIPLAWAEGMADGRIKKGDLLLIEAMGGGLTWGACVIRL